MAIQQYIVKSDERWDNIAFKAYGTTANIEIIIKANPNVDITPVVPAGTILNIPIIDEETLSTSTDILPPWMQ